MKWLEEIENNKTITSEHLETALLLIEELLMCQHKTGLDVFVLLLMREKIKTLIKKKNK